MLQQIEIQPYEPAYLDAIVSLSLKAWEPVFASVESSFAPELFNYFYPDWRAHQQKDVEKACNSDAMHVGVACIGDSVAGFVAFRLGEQDRTGEIYMIAVDPAHQRKGISGKLTDYATQAMRAAGMEICMLSTGADPGHEPARRSYEKSGFKPWHSVIYFKQL
ncbi:MAG: GNAT family N-acetyltransferase [Gammaproteobacteria bacterium]